jgi:hypothetical protein
MMFARRSRWASADACPLAENRYTRLHARAPFHSRMHGRKTMDRKVIEIELTAEERTLILQYGYPFDGIKQSLNACQDNKRVEMLPIDTFEL